MPEESEYVATLRQEHGEGLSRLAIERSILRQWQPVWSREGSPYGQKWSDHFREYCALVFPEKDWHPFYQRQTEKFEEVVFVMEKKILNFIGSASSSKTDWAAVFSHIMVSVWPEYTNVFIAAPYMSSAESTIWARVDSCCDEFKKANEHLWKDVSYAKSAKRIDFNNLAERGSIELKTLDKVSKLQGTKSYDPNKGFMILFLDELALFPNLEVLKLLNNLRKNKNFVCISGCNFKSTQTLEGQLCEPEGMEYSDLDVDEDQEWPSAYKSYTVRLDGRYSPNIAAGHDIYDYLLSNKEYYDSVEMHGERGPEHMEQGRSFPVDSISDAYVTTREKIRAGGGEDEGYVFDSGGATRTSFLDPGWGNDAAMIGAFEFSTARLQDSEGNYHSGEIFMPICAIETIKLEVGKVADQEWIDRLHAQSGGAMMFIMGQPVTMDMQMAVATGEFLQKHNIPKDHFGFDDSLRSSIVTALISVLGQSIHAISSIGTASDRVVTLNGGKAEDLYANQVTEYWFNVADMIQRGQFRGAKLIPGAVSQLCRRKWEHKGKKKKLETKAEYKATNQGKSPNDADVLCGGYEMAKRHGFAQNQRSRPESIQSVQAIIEMIENSDRFREPGVKKLNK